MLGLGDWGAGGLGGGVEQSYAGGLTQTGAWGALECGVRPWTDREEEGEEVKARERKRERWGEICQNPKDELGRGCKRGTPRRMFFCLHVREGSRWVCQHVPTDVSSCVITHRLSTRKQCLAKEMEGTLDMPHARNRNKMYRGASGKKQRHAAFQDVCVLRSKKGFIKYCLQ